MAAHRRTGPRSFARMRMLALAAAGGVLATGAVVASLAAWTDEEYVAGGAGSNAGVSTSIFEVQQLVSSDGTTWADREDPAGPYGPIDFGTIAESLTPGDTVYGWVQLRTVADSADGTLTLVADGVDTANDLSDALRYGAVIVANTGSCTPAGYASVAGGTSTPALDDPILVTSGSALTANGDNAFALSGDQAETITVCFELSLPGTPANQANSALQGLTAVPVWHFAAVSD